MPQFTYDKSLVFTTGKFAIIVDLTNGKEIFRTESEGRYSISVLDRLITFKDTKVLLDG